MKVIKILIIIIIPLLFSCDKGLSPISEDEVKLTGFKGTVTFIGDWDKSVARTHVVLFKEPLLSKNDFNIFNLKYVSDTIPNGSNIFNFNSTEESLISNVLPGEYSYLAVAQSKQLSLSLNREDWIVVGVYYENNDTTKPGILKIPENNLVENINITCDFNNPPPQPPSLAEYFNQLKILE